ncbi:MAG: 3'(2'),5'-bisphosphate nucleotidase CysQ [Spirochaetaceae bacterium]|nr:MAG: 3'(2'),5'-bisphosphate nucleotidase CysQ [Spirochaetaceae bacterium]
MIANSATDYALLALRAAVAAGADILDVYRGRIAVELKDDRSPLTEADMRAHRRIVALLEAAGDRNPILSEEASDIPFDRRERWRRYWLVDPLDGTKEFIKRNGEFTVNIALVEQSADGGGLPVAGVVYAPDLQRAYVGVVGLGAWRIDDLPADVASGTPGAARTASWDDFVAAATRLPVTANGGARRPFTVVASRSHMSPETQAYIDELRADHPDLQLISAGSALKLCLVAEGAADVYPRFAPTMEWDTGAGHAVCLAAGLTVNSWPAAEPLEYNKPQLVNPWFLVSRGGQRS